MANATAYTPIDMDHWHFWDRKNVPIHSSTHIQETGYTGQVQDYYGSSFTYGADSVTGGTLQSTTYKLYGVLQYQVTGLHHSAATVANYIDNDNTAVLPFLFNGNDTFNGSSGNDVLNGYNGNDTINGNGGNDFLRGNGGSDTLKGGAGNDILKGLAGADVLSGGAGADWFDFDSLSDSTNAARDKINDFNPAQGDRIDLSGVDANGAGAGNGAFQFIGTNAFSGNSTGKLRFDAENHVLLGSTDSDTAAEFAILLPGVNSMTGTNFVP